MNKTGEMNVIQEDRVIVHVTRGWQWWWKKIVFWPSIIFQ